LFMQSLRCPTKGGISVGWIVNGFALSHQGRRKILRLQLAHIYLEELVGP